MASTYTYEQLKEQLLKKLNAKPDTKYLLDKYVTEGGQSPFNYMNPFLAIKSPSTAMFLVMVVEEYVNKRQNSLYKVADILATLYLEAAVLVEMINMVNHQLYKKGPRNSGVGKTLINSVVGGGTDQEGLLRVNTVNAKKERVWLNFSILEGLESMLQGRPLSDCTFSISGSHALLADKAKFIKFQLL